MGEYVWTKYAIGGKLKAEAVGALHELTDEFDNSADVFEAVQEGTSLIVEGERNYGNYEELDAFCIKRGLTFWVSWAAQPGCFDAGIRYWKPGMEAIGECSANDDSDPTFCLQELRKLAADGMTMADAIARLSTADITQIPKLEIEQAAEAAA